MIVEGDADELSRELFPHGLVPQIMGLIVDTWAGFDRPVNGEDEPKITNRFTLALQQERRRRGAKFRIMPHVKDVKDIDAATGKGFVEIDIYIPHGYDERCYFGIEAKKLNTTANGRWQSRAGEYAGKEGMECFVDGRYAAYQCEGAMVGYVMDGDCGSARKSISNAIDSNATNLRVTVPCVLHASQDLPSYSNAFETRHSLNRTVLTMYHILLAA